MIYIDKSSEGLLDILKVFHHITEMVADTREEPDKLLNNILNLTVSMLNVSHASILLLDQKRRRFKTVANYGSFPVSLDLKAVSDATKIAGCPANDEKLPFTEFVASSEWSQLPPEDRRFLENMHCLPLHSQGKILGMHCVYGKEFQPGVVENQILCMLAALASLAIEKSDLYSRIHEKLQITREELKRTQSQLIRSEKLSSLVEIAMSIAHSIRNPVTVIGGMSQRIHKALPENDPKRKMTLIILEEASRLESIVNDFNRFFLIKQISFENVDMNRIVEETSREFLSEFGVTTEVALKKSLYPEPLWCRVDPNLIKRSLLHLMVNAKEASSNGVQIIVTTSRMNDEAIIEVSDKGRGLTREEMDHIFDPFYTTKGTGAGIGLTFVHFIISEHSGQIDLHSAKGAGTQLRIRLPLAESSKMEK